jgi:hypothetical protein
MLRSWLEYQAAGLWTLVWHYGIGVGVCICALAWAWFMPVFKKTALWVALGSLIVTTSYGIGVSNGSARVKAQWDAAIAASIEQSEKARSDAERDMSRDAPSQLPNDRYNRDNAGR